MAESANFDHAVAAVMYHARTLAANASDVNQVLSENDSSDNEGDVKPQWKEEWYDGLGFCKWRLK